MKPAQLPSTEARAEQAHLAEVMKIQRDMARRRRRKSVLLFARLSVFVLLPTFLAALYFYTIATPMYAAKTQFVIQQAESPSASGMGGLFSSTPMATAQDSIAVQGYLQSQVAMQRLEADNGFREHFSSDEIDVIQRLPPDASESAVYKLYKKIIRISYDPTEGVVKMEVTAADPQKAVEYSNALIGYAEEQVDQMTQRLREDQMKGARESYEDAEKKYQEANIRLVELQERFKILSSEAEIGLITSQIGQLETQLTQDQLSLAQMEANQNPNKARMDPLKRRIDTLQVQIAELRGKLTDQGQDGVSLAQVQSDLLVAQADAQTRQLLLAQSLQAMETARVEANRQTRYLSVAVAPVAPDEAAYPRAFENTLVVMLIFAGIYLMISMTVAILREQVSA
jgi:capsular polysaccharide transport system permease protein